MGGTKKRVFPDMTYIPFFRCHLSVANVEMFIKKFWAIFEIFSLLHDFGHFWHVFVGWQPFKINFSKKLKKGLGVFTNFISNQNFSQIGPLVPEISVVTDGQTDRRTDGQTHKKNFPSKKYFFWNRGAR